MANETLKLERLVNDPVTEPSKLPLKPSNLVDGHTDYAKELIIRNISDRLSDPDNIEKYMEEDAITIIERVYHNNPEIESFIGFIKTSCILMHENKDNLYQKSDVESYKWMLQFINFNLCMVKKRGIDSENINERNETIKLLYKCMGMLHKLASETAPEKSRNDFLKMTNTDYALAENTSGIGDRPETSSLFLKMITNEKKGNELLEKAKKNDLLPTT